MYFSRKIKDLTVMLKKFKSFKCSKIGIDLKLINKNKRKELFSARSMKTI